MTKRLGIGAMLQELMGSLLFRKRATVLYPIERLEPPERFRGRLLYDADTCTLCGLCARDCPGMVIKVVSPPSSSRRKVVWFSRKRKNFSRIGIVGIFL